MNFSQISEAKKTTANILRFSVSGFLRMIQLGRKRFLRFGCGMNTLTSGSERTLGRTLSLHRRKIIVELLQSINYGVVLCEGVLVLEDFEKNGFEIVRNLLGPEIINQAKTVFEEALAPTLDQMTILGIRVGTENMVADINQLLSSPEAKEIDRDLRMIMTGQFPLNVRMDRRLWVVPQSPELQKALTLLLGSPNLRMHSPPMARFVYPGNSNAGVPAHQDVAYNKHLSNFITCWIPLVDIDFECGGVTVYPGSDGLQRDPELLGHGVWYEGIDLADFEPFDCEPMALGDVLFFNRHLAHKSMANKSNKIRYSLDLRFFSDMDTSTKHYLDMRTWEIFEPNG